MKVAEEKNVYMHGMGKSVLQGISKEHMAMATAFLREKIYSDPFKAAISEPLCNAVDEHRKHNVDRPVEVYICHSEVVIRDFGKGLSEDDTFNVFFQYFESTKNKTNDSIGGFGIGAKAPAALSGKFYVESYYEGKRKVFASIVTGLEAVVTKVHEEDCAADDTGIAVRIPMNMSENSVKLRTLLSDLYLMMGMNDSKPVFNVRRVTNCLTYSEVKKNIDSIPAPEESSRPFFGYNRLADMDNKPIVQKDLVYYPGLAIIWKDCEMFSYSMFMHKVMMYDGDMVYDIDPSPEQTKYIDKLADINGSYWSSSKSRILFLFNRGEVKPVPSREKIEQSPALSKLIKDKTNAIVDLITADIGDAVYSEFLAGKLSIESYANRFDSCVLGGVLKAAIRGSNSKLETLLELHNNYKTIVCTNRWAWRFSATYDSEARVSRTKFSDNRDTTLHELRTYKKVFFIGERKRSMKDIATAAGIKFGEYPIIFLCFESEREVWNALFSGLALSDEERGIVKNQFTVFYANEVDKLVPFVKKERAKKTTAVEKEDTTIQRKAVNHIGTFNENFIPKDGKEIMIVASGVIGEDTMALVSVRNGMLNAPGNSDSNVPTFLQKVLGVSHIVTASADSTKYWLEHGAVKYDKETVSKKVREYIKEERIIYSRDKNDILSALSLIGSQDYEIILARPVIGAAYSSSIEPCALDSVIARFAPECCVKSSQVSALFSEIKTDKSKKAFVEFMLLQRSIFSLNSGYSTIKDEIADTIDACKLKSVSFANKFLKKIEKVIGK